VPFASDFRQALRSLLRRPGFTIVGATMLALGIGANTAMFSAVFHTLIRPLPFADPRSLAYVYQAAEGGGLMISPPMEYVDAWQAKPLRTAERLEPFARREFTLLGGEEPEVVPGAEIGPGVLALVGLEPIIGRNFVAGDVEYGAPDVALISEGFWKRRFGRERQALGQRITLDEKSYEIVGVVPDAMASLGGLSEEGQVWVPLQRAPGHRVFATTLMRLRSGVTVEQAEAELQRIFDGVKVEHELPGKFTIQLSLPQDDNNAKDTLKVLVAAVALVLLIACANLAGLLLVRLAARRREIAIRAALGAGRFTIVRHLWAEALLLAMLGGGLGVLMATWGVDVVRTLRPETLGSLDAMRMDGPTLGFAAVLALVTAFLFGIVPVFSFLRGDLTSSIIAGGGSTARVTESGRLRTVLVTGEIAISVVLLVGALLLIRSVQQMQRVPLGFDRSNLITARIVTPDSRYATPDARKAFARQVIEGIQALPAARSATIGSGLPPSLGMMFLGGIEIEGKPGIGDKLGPAVGGGMIEPGYFQTLGARVVEGRVWGPGELRGPIIINREMASRLWPGESAVGKRLRTTGGKELIWQTVIGVVDNLPSGRVTSKPGPQLFELMAYEWHEMMLAVRVNNGDPRSIVPALKQVVQRIDPTIPLRDVATMDDLLADSMANQRFTMSLLTLFAFLAFLLALVGLYGVISNMVSRRAREIGVRLALGATPHGVQSMVLREGMIMTGIGLSIGGVASLGLVRFIQSQLYGVVPRDPASFALAIVLLGAGALFACWLPARRATRVDPLVVLRSE
jgi:putative ABC transport system permease protein